MQVEQFFRRYIVRGLSDENVDAIYLLCNKDTLYYEYCPPFITHQGILNDVKELPPGKTIEEKYNIGFYHQEKLIAVMDLIDGFPEDDIAYIGFFMTDTSIKIEVQEQKSLNIYVSILWIWVISLYHQLG